jgi:hypothetical protein
MPTNIQRDLAEYVREGLRKTGRTQRQLADGAGVTTKHVTMVLSGKSAASVQMWQKLVTAAWEGAIEPRDRDADIVEVH